MEERKEIYNLRNKTCQIKFFDYTNNSDILTKSLINKDVKTGGKLWIKNLKCMIMQTFKKIIITSKDKSNQKIDKLLEERSANSDRTKLDQCIAQLSYERNRKLIVDQVTEMSDNACNFSRVKMWKVKQKLIKMVT